MSVWAWQRFVAKNPNSLTVRYEDLIRFPKETLASICCFLEIDYQTILETPTKNGKLWMGNSLHGDEFKGLSTKPIGRWRGKLPEEQLILIEAYLGRTMICFGYQLATEPPTLLKMISHWRQQSRKKKQLLGMLMRLYWPFQLPQRLEARRGL